MIPFKKPLMVSVFVSLLFPLHWAIPVVPDSSEIDAGCSGGYNGSGSGVSVQNTGVILGWSMASYRDPKQTRPLRTDMKTAKTLFDELQSIKFTSTHHNQPANMSCFLRLTKNGKKIHEVQWPFGNTEAPPRVLKLYQKVRALADPALSTP